MLQIAVVLFLVGLYFFLNEANERITIVYSAVTLFPFVLYATSLFLPLLLPECPFKSPLVPSVAFVLKLLQFLSYVFVMAFAILPAILLARLVTALLVRYGGVATTCSIRAQHFRWRLFAIASRFELHMRNLHASLFKQTGDFWPNLELQYLRRTGKRYQKADEQADGNADENADEKADEKADETADRKTDEKADRKTDKKADKKVDSDVFHSDFADALSAAPTFVPRTEFTRLKDCYTSMHPAQRTRCALNWTAMHLGYSGEEDISESRRWELIDAKFVEKVDKYFGTSLKALLLGSLPEDLSKTDWVREVPDIARVFLMLNQLVKLHDIGLRDAFAPMLLDACEQQKVVSKGFWPNERIRGMSLPTICLFQCSLEYTEKAGVFQFNDSRAHLGLLL